MRQRVPHRVPHRVPMAPPARGSVAAAHPARARNAVSPIKVPVIKVSLIKVSVNPGPVYRAWMGRPLQGRRTTVPHMKVHPMVRAVSARSGTCIACA